MYLSRRNLLDSYTTPKMIIYCFQSKKGAISIIIRNELNWGPIWFTRMNCFIWGQISRWKRCFFDVLVLIDALPKLRTKRNKNFSKTIQLFRNELNWGPIRFTCMNCFIWGWISRRKRCFFSMFWVLIDASPKLTARPPQPVICELKRK